MIDRTVHSAAFATTRFGFGPRPGEIAVVATDPRGWLLEQVRAKTYDSPRELAGLSSAQSILAEFLSARDQRQARKRDPMGGGGASATDPVAQLVGGVRQHLLPHYMAQAAARTRIALTTPASFRERLVQFWSNHFAVSVDKPITLGIAGAMENDAIRPHVTGRFRDLLVAAETHPAMITYLDNERSAGPNSKAAVRSAGRPRSGDGAGRHIGINENLAREILELHTLGVDGGYTQKDVTTFAEVLSGWSIGGGRFPQGEPGSFQFREPIHEPGAKILLGKRYADDGFRQGMAVLDDLARHPATARHLATKLARHFVADDPPGPLVERLARVYLDSEGDLPSVYASLVDWEGAWARAPAKFKTPQEFIYSALRGFAIVPDSPERLLAPFNLLGQPHFKPGSPAGWPDRASDWDGADALMKRIEWSSALAARVGDTRPVTETAQSVLGPLLSSQSQASIARASSGAEGIALLLMSPEFQRR